MLEFVTAAKEASEDDDVRLEFSVDGKVFRAYRPKDGQLAMLMASLGTYKGNREATAGVIDFFMGVLDLEDQAYFANRLMDRDDAFEIDSVQGILRGMVKEWTARPTKQPSGSTSSRGSTGSVSTVSTPTSI